MVRGGESNDAGLSSLELDRINRIRSNRMMMEQELGLQEAADEISKQAKKTEPKKKPNRKKKARGSDEEYELESESEPEPERRSTRDVKRVASYREDDYYGDALPRLYRGSRGPREVREVDEENLALLREKHGSQQGGEARGGKKRGPQDSGKGVRVQGGRVYDSTFGVTCHWCRQKTLEDKVTCTSPGCGKGKRLPTTFCKMCLKNRHGEDFAQATASAKWVCPLCRVSCGPGCVCCCNCGPCRKKAGLEPTHQLVKSAQQAGFDNAHDYLIHLVTKEDPEEIAERKTHSSHSWGAWLNGSHSEEGDEVGDDLVEAALAPPIHEEPQPKRARGRVKAARGRELDDGVVTSAVQTPDALKPRGSRKAAAAIPTSPLTAKLTAASFEQKAEEGNAKTEAERSRKDRAKEKLGL